MLSAPVRPADAGLEQLPSGLRRTSQRPPPVWTLEPAPRVSVLGCRNQVPQNGVCACGGGAGGGAYCPVVPEARGSKSRNPAHIFTPRRLCLLQLQGAARGPGLRGAPLRALPVTPGPPCPCLCLLLVRTLVTLDRGVHPPPARPRPYSLPL